MERHIQHFQYWVLLTLFSIVTLTSLTNSFKNDEQNDTNEWTKRQRWVISMAAISLILSMVACGGHLVTHDKFCEKPIELPLVRFWLVWVLRHIDICSLASVSQMILSIYFLRPAGGTGACHLVCWTPNLDGPRPRLCCYSFHL